MKALDILVADDNPTDRFLLKKLLEHDGHQVRCAVDGVQALEMFQQSRPGLVLLDALMPSVDGFSTARKIKKLAGENFIPIIFITGLEHRAWLEQCLEAGGDDVLIKPFNPVVLRTKIQAFARMSEQQSSLQFQQRELFRARKHFEYEQSIAKNILDKVLDQGCLERHDIRYLLSPLAVFNGDVLLAAEYQSGELAVLLGDFTGHGLAAAIGAIPLAEVFYEMVEKNFNLQEILREANRKLHDILTVDVFCCAGAFVFHPDEKLLQVWNGGLPDIQVLRVGQKPVSRFPSIHLPLGVLEDKKFSGSLAATTLEPGDRVLAHTDGLLEATDEQGRFFGVQGIEQALLKPGDSAFGKLVDALQEHTGQQKQHDDLSLMEFVVSGQASASCPASLQLSSNNQYHFRHDMIRNESPAHLLHKHLMQFENLQDYSAEILLVLNELINNAIEHGLLALDSALKQSREGFTEYYRQRAEKKSSLDKGFIDVQLAVSQFQDRCEINIKVTDSGSGFDYRYLKQDERIKNKAGHGIYLLKKLCQDVSFLGAGNIVQVSCVFPVR